MQVPDVALPEILPGDAPPSPGPDPRVWAPELWPLSLWDGVWIVVGVAAARMLAQFV